MKLFGAGRRGTCWRRLKPINMSWIAQPGSSGAISSAMRSKMKQSQRSRRYTMDCGCLRTDAEMFLFDLSSELERILERSSQAVCRVRFFLRHDQRRLIGFRGMLHDTLCLLGLRCRDRVAWCLASQNMLQGLVYLVCSLKANSGL